MSYILGVKAVSYTRTAIKALKSLPARDRDAIMDKMDAYADGRPQDVVALKGSDFLRLRHRDWRGIFEEGAETIAVLDIAHRREVYRWNGEPNVESTDHPRRAERARLCRAALG